MDSTTKIISLLVPQEAGLRTQRGLRTVPGKMKGFLIHLLNQDPVHHLNVVQLICWHIQRRRESDCIGIFITMRVCKNENSQIFDVWHHFRTLHANKCTSLISNLFFPNFHNQNIDIMLRKQFHKICHTL